MNKAKKIEGREVENQLKTTSSPSISAKGFAIAVFAVAIGLLAACGDETSGEVPKVTQSQFDERPADVRDFRYCEIIPVFRDGVTFNVEVYNTQDLNRCPAELWDELDSEVMVEEYGAVEVKINGPRFWVLNDVVGADENTNPPVADFGGIEFAMVAVIETKVWEGTVGDEYYVENEVQRSTTYTYNAGEIVYELTSPEGDVYRMQSYTQLFDTDLTIDDLETLGDALDLPDGWSYEARTLDEESLLVAPGIAYIVNDDLANSYQKITE